MDILRNPIFMFVLVTVIVCHIWKFIDKSFRKKELAWSALVENGVMPSSHSSFVCSLATSIGLVEGFDSTIFLLSLGFAFIVVRDAFGVRHAVDNLAETVNEIIRQKKLGVSEMLKITGHTPIQAVVGVILGVGIPLIMHYGFGI